MNKIILSGRLVRDPEVRYSQNGADSLAVARTSIAVNPYRGDNADFFNLVFFGKTGESAEKYLKQGVKVIIEGRAQPGRFTNKEGQTVNTFDIVVERWEFAESKKAAEGNTNTTNSNQAKGNGKPKNNANTNANTPNDGFMDIPDNIDTSGLPFNF